MIAARMKYQWLASVPAIFFDLTKNNDMIAAVKSPGDAANKMRRGPFQQGAAVGGILTFDACELVRKSGGELPRDTMLPGRQYVDREKAGSVEGSKIGGLPREAPEHERGIERYGGKRVHRQPDGAPVLCARGDDGYARSELAERMAKIPTVEVSCFGSCTPLRMRLGLFHFHKPDATLSRSLCVTNTEGEYLAKTTEVPYRKTLDSRNRREQNVSLQGSSLS